MRPVKLKRKLVKVACLSYFKVTLKPMIMTESQSKNYIGRFAPTPSGELHLGSLVGALGSWLEAKKAGGSWRLRIDDIDQNRTQAGAIDSILRCLEAFGLTWDGPVIYQSSRIDLYREFLAQLVKKDKAYHCQCSRKEIIKRVDFGVEGPIYDGKCRGNLTQEKSSIRLNTAGTKVTWQDQFLGAQSCNLDQELGDFVLWRSDDVCSYHLANVVDDHHDQITDVVRGVDLLVSTHRQIYLQQCLGIAPPNYAHLPLVFNLDGKKLSKQTGAQGLNQKAPAGELILALQYLNQIPPSQLVKESVTDILSWAKNNYQSHKTLG